MKVLTRRAFFTAGAALALPAAGVILTKIGSEPTRLPLPTARPTLPYPRRAPAQINVFSKAKLPLGVEPARFTAAMQRYVTEFLAPVWDCPATLQWSADAVKGMMNLALVDEIEVDGAIAYHSYDPEVMKLPYGEIGVVESYLDGTNDLGVPFSHELGEMLVNPGVNMWAGVAPWYPGDPTDGDTQLRAYEIADPVERTFFLLDGVRMSNFVYPSYFEPWLDGAQFDFLKMLKAPGQILQGGYQLIRNHDQVFQVTNPSNVPKFCCRVEQMLNMRRNICNGASVRPVTRRVAPTGLSGLAAFGTPESFRPNGLM